MKEINVRKEGKNICCLSVVLHFVIVNIFLKQHRITDQTFWAFRFYDFIFSYTVFFHKCEICEWSVRCYPKHRWKKIISLNRIGDVSRMERFVFQLSYLTVQYDSTLVIFLISNVYDVKNIKYFRRRISGNIFIHVSSYEMCNF